VGQWGPTPRQWGRPLTPSFKKKEPGFYPDIAAVKIWGFAAFINIWFLQVGIRKPILGDIRIELIVGTVLLALALLTQPAPEEKGIQPSGIKNYVIAFCIVLLLALPMSYDFLISKKIFWDRIVKFGCMALFLWKFVKSPKGLRFIMGAYILAWLYICQESFRGAVTGAMMWQNQGIMRLHGDTPMFQHPNSLGGFAVSTVPFVFYLYPIVRKRWAKIALGALLFTASACVLYSGSRTAYLGYLIFLLFAFMKSRRKFVSVILLGIVVSSAVPYLPLEYKGRFESIFTGKEAEGASTETRKQILRDAWAVFKDNPLGIGLGTFPAVREDRFGRVQDTHNLYMEVLVNLGFHGFIVFLLLMRKVYTVFRDTAGGLLEQIDKIAALPTDKKTPPALAAVRAEHLADLRFVRAVTLGGMGYLIVRLCIGFFGTDLYEVQWWIAIGFSATLFRLQHLLARRTQTLLTPPTDAPRETAALA